MTALRYREFNALKILHHIERLMALARGQDVPPITVEIDPVAYCNHACGWCVDPVHSPIQMDLDTFTKLINELANFSINGFGVAGIVFKGGGEPTLHPEFDQMVLRASDLGFAIGVVTNGSRLTRWADVLAAKAAYVRVSIDGPTAESHARIHRSRDFEDILTGVSRLLRARREKRQPVVGFSFAMDIHTVDLAGEAIRLGERFGVDYVLLRPPFFEEVGSEPTMTIAEAQSVRRKLQESATNYSGSLELFIGNWVGDREQQVMQRTTLTASGRRAMQAGIDLPIEHRCGRCVASPILAVVTAGGDLYGCCNLRALPGWSFGRIDYDAGISFSDLWGGAQRQTVLARMHDAACIQHCTHPLSRYNEMLEVLMDDERPHSQFV